MSDINVVKIKFQRGKVVLKGERRRRLSPKPTTNLS